ncbi:MAG: STAS domain-containing protein [bacterium]|nr:STAS domain-containing protein [bacterium]
MKIIHQNKNNREVTLKFNGIMDTRKCIDIEGKILSEIEGADQINFDLTEVEYVSSTFIKLCIKTSKKTNIKRLSILNTTPNVGKVFKILGLDKNLNYQSNKLNKHHTT